MSVAPNAGTFVRLSLNGATPLPVGQHLELWARNANDDIIRIRGLYDAADPVQPGKSTHYEPRGLAIRLAISMDDPCMIDEAGHLLVSPDAYPRTVTIDGVEQTPDEQAAQVRARIAQLVPPSSCDGSGLNPVSHCGRQSSQLYAVVPYQLVDEAGNVQVPASPPKVAFDAAPAERRAACEAYWASSPLAYTPNPAQLTAPAHGTLYGFVAFTSTTPSASYDYVNIDSPERLAGIRELFLTVEPDQVDPLRRGSTYLQGTPGAGGASWVHFDLRPPFGSSLPVVGTAALFVDPDSNPVEF